MRFVMRPATSQDADAAAAMILARCAWMEERGMPSWRSSVDDLAAQSANPDGDDWVLEDVERSRLVGRTTLQEHSPPWGWTDAERAEPYLYLYTTVTDPAYRAYRPGSLIASWAVDRAAAEGKTWVRRDCLWPGLVRYYTSQGFDLVRETPRGSHTLYLMARRAAPVAGLPQLVSTGTPASPGTGR